jgi:cell division protein DivIC
MKISKGKILKIFKNKYVLTTLLFVIWMLFFDQNNIIDRVLTFREHKQLQNEKEYYLEKIQTDSLKLNELRTNKDNLEKYAREQYMMKKDSEDIFLIDE